MLNRAFGAIDRGAEGLAATIFGLIVGIALIQVFCRYALNYSLSWSEEAQIFGHIWIVFLGIPIAYRRGAHLYIETFCDMLPPGPRSIFNLVLELTWLAFALSLMVLGLQVARVAHLQESPGLEVPMSYPYFGMVLGGAYLLLVALRRIGASLSEGARVIWFLLLLMLGTMLIGVPILLSIALVGYVGVAAVPGLVLPLFAQKMFAQLDSFTLLALPYFILAGALMSASGMSQQLVDFSRVLVGHLRAGLAHAAVVASMVFAGVSGSSTADASAIAAIVVPTMKQSGYKPGFAAALIATAGTIGAIIPPSMTMVVYGSIAQVSIGGLFLGGIIPGILVGLFLMATIKIYTYHPDYPELRTTHGRFSWAALGRSLLAVWPALLGPVIIVGGILTGIFTATEAGAVACLYAFLLGMFLYRRIKWRDLPKILLDSAVMTTMVSGIIAVAGASGWLLGYLQFNEGALKFVTSMSQDPTMVLLILAAVMIVLGTFVDSLAVLLVFAPAAIQISKVYGIDPFQMGLVMVMCNQIGAVSPPTAPLLFVTTSIAQTTYAEVNRHVWWFMLAETLVLVMVILIPGLAAWIPHFFFG